MGALQGKLLGVKVNGVFVRCQTDATLNININVTDDEPCKPTETDTTNGTSWTTHTVDSKDWSLSVTAKAFADVEAGIFDNSDIAELMTVGNPSVEAVFQTIQTTDYNHPAVFLYEGTGTLTSFSHNAPSDGESTYDLEITGNGALTFTKTPVTT